MPPEGGATNQRPPEGGTTNFYEANEGMVAKLKVYRSSVIWEAVTGKTCL